MLLRQRTGRPNSACGLHYDLCRFGLRCLIQNSADCSSFMPKLTTTARSTRGLANNFNCITGRKKKTNLLLKAPCYYWDYQSKETYSCEQSRAPLGMTNSFRQSMSIKPPSTSYSPSTAEHLTGHASYHSYIYRVYVGAVPHLPPAVRQHPVTRHYRPFRSTSRAGWVCSQPSNFTPKGPGQQGLSA